MAPGKLLAAALVVFSSTLLASEKARSFSIAYAGGTARVTVPKKFAPLLPGSVYPNRKRPIPASACPVAVIQPWEGGARFAALFREDLLERGFLLAETGRPCGGDPSLLLVALALHPEADPGRAVLVSGGDALPPAPGRFAATVLFDPALRSGDGGGSARARPETLAVFLRTPALRPGADLSRRLQRQFGPAVEEKWYRTEADFPEQAFRDAAEWLCARLNEIR